jgi:hypothetical protein
MTKKMLAAIEARQKGATQWTPKDCALPEPDEDGYQPEPSECAALGQTNIQFCGGYEGGGKDWLFLAHVHDDIKALIAEVKHLRGDP